MISLKKESGSVAVALEAMPLGDQWNVALTGGRAHLGAVALGIPRPSLKDGSRTSASVSVLTVTGHRDDEVARTAAHFIASRLDTAAAVCCGIHYDDLTPQGLGTVERLVAGLLEEFVENAGSKADDA